MRKSFIGFVAVLLLALTPYAQAQTCAGTSCNFIDAAGNSGFQSGFTGWSTGGAVIADPGACGTKMAEIDPGDYVTRNQFQVNDSFSSYKVVYKAWLLNTTGNFYDELKVRVTNDDSGVYEEYSLHGPSSNDCNYKTFYLSNDYDNAHVTVKFYTGNFTIRTWQIDDVGFFATY